MKTYVVGGAVRDDLLGLPVSDRDHVVIGATVDEMIAAGFKPVGRDFPVFLHPVTHEEYALARTERKVAAGYAGFVFHADRFVSLEDDLARRDLTINAIAEDEATGVLIDPFGGKADLAARTFRHVGPSFVEDPVRLLRIARFAARFGDFTVAPETLELMRAMTAAGEVDALVPERVWQEISRGLMEVQPSRMVRLLRESGALGRLFPEIEGLFASDAGPAMLAALDRVAATDASLEIRFAVLVEAIGGDAIPTLCGRLAVPRAARDLALLVAKEGPTLRAAVGPTPPAIDVLVDAMERADAFRRPDRFRQAIAALGWTIDDDDVRQKLSTRLGEAVDAALAIDAGVIARDAGYDPALIVGRLRHARVLAVEIAMDPIRRRR
ncbi:MAG: multifunctional CCA tRNA nucleotidyl transferase/2'3'-cyclic phosphodiesterase/2'nucleotidase/phosphatase [Burkholderiaceae bacterium]